MQDDWIERAKKVIPGGSQTYSKSSRYFTRPMVAITGAGCRLSTNIGILTDFNMALGAIILGYKHLSFFDKELQFEPFIYSLPHKIEIEVAEKLCSIISSAQMAKFFKNGSDAVEIAVRLARAYTGKTTIKWMSYHGFHDSYLASLSNSKGIPTSYRNDNVEATELCFNDLAAIVVEPNHPGIENFVKMAKDYNCLIIFDEVLTGFRHGVGGLQKHIGITPDLSCFGKCMANGLPLSAVVGRADIMQLLEEGVFGSSTFGGEVLSLQVCMETIKLLENAKDYLWKIGQRYLDGIDKKQAEKFGVIKGYPPRCGIEFSDLKFKSHFQDELLKRGFLVNGLNNFCLAHKKDDIDKYIEAVNEVLKVMEMEEYKGELIRPMFQR